MVGGGQPPQPGEVSLAHHGVLFLDELPEFAPHVLDTLRQPLEEGAVTVTRASGRLTFPAAFMLVRAMNPCRRACPTQEACTCTVAERRRHAGRLSGPLLDRVDLQVTVSPLEAAERRGAALSSSNGSVAAGGGSAAVRRRVASARARQQTRSGGASTWLNGRLGIRDLERDCRLDGDGESLLERAAGRLGLSARGHDRLLRVARTIADLEGAERIGPDHLAEALQYRLPDRPPS